MEMMLLSSDRAPGGAPPRGHWRAALVSLAIHAAAAFVFLSPGYIRPDSVGIYSYLRSAFLDRNLLFVDEWEKFGMVANGFTYFKEVTPLGTLANHWWVGTSILSAPFYAAAHAITLLVPSLGGDGFFGLYGATLAWSSVLFGALASLAGDALLRRYAGTLSAGKRLLALAAIGLGTPFFWYELRFPLGAQV